MPIPVRCGCGSSFTLKDEYAGRVLRCPNCNAAIQVGQPVAGAPAAAGTAAPMAAAGSPVAPQADPIFDRDKFLLRQQHFAIDEKYYVHDEQGNAIIYVERPAFLGKNLLALGAAVVAFFIGLGVMGAVVSALGESAAAGIAGFFFLLLAMAGAVAAFLWIMPLRHVTFYQDDSGTVRLLEVLQDQKFAFPTVTFTVRDAQGRTLSKFRKNYLYDIFRKQWGIDSPDGREMCIAKEDSLILSLLRRWLGPLFGALRTNFIILREDNVIGEFNRKLTLLDRYVLDMSADPRRTLDRRVALALGVMLDTAEKR